MPHNTIPSDIQDKLKTDCHRWALANGRRDGNQWRVPIDTGREVTFPLKSFDGAAPPDPFPYPLPVAESPLFVCAVYTEYCEEAGGDALINKLESLHAWKLAVEMLQQEAERIQWLSQAAHLSESDIEERLLNPVLFDKSAQSILAAHGLPTTPGTQRYLIARSLEPKQIPKPQDMPTRGVMVVSVCLAPYAFDSFREVDGASEIIPVLTWSGDLSGDVVAQVLGSAQWDGNAWRDVPKVVSKHRDRWFEVSQVIQAGNLSGGSKTDLPDEAVAVLWKAFQKGQYEPYTQARRDTRDEVHHICERVEGKTLNANLIKKQADSLVERWRKTDVPPNT